jgi:ribosomal protein S18 acetylase RimI-like enzyme
VSAAAEPGPAIAIRRLSVADAECYRAFRLAALEHTPTAFTSSHAEESSKPLSATAARLAAAQHGSGALLGAFTGARDLVGTAGLSVPAREQERHKGTLFGMAVAPEASGRGIGRSLVQQILRVAAEDDRLRQVILTVSEGNTAAIRLYASCGFTVWGREPQAVIVDGVPVAKLHMARILA